VNRLNNFVNESLGEVVSYGTIYSKIGLKKTSLIALVITIMLNQLKLMLIKNLGRYRHYQIILMEERDEDYVFILYVIKVYVVHVGSLLLLVLFLIDFVLMDMMLCSLLNTLLLVSKILILMAAMEGIR